MPRAKEYSKEEVLNTATKVFWKRGFKNTSISDLVNATGLNKHSMYGEFENKEGLFLACIDHYVNTSTKYLMDILKEEPLGIGNIKAFIKNRIEYATSGEFDGCLLVNTTVEKHLLDEKINKIVNKELYGQKNLFHACLVAAQKNGEISTEKDCEILADYLMCFLEGLMIVGKTNPTKRSLNNIMDTTMGAILK
ncbi:TetR/AcrR family transcriptional regulator [Xanthovirga aplysinae]|uniref:TetR/AcrR family transcriptional regulator n=1 Tax=Xanthovirga aplysinae TaxID=2529853 RepID=UPI0012BC1C41|nr:TetR/AcrR family transcriptional regulator [Xanthovirga aplysinae]MTI29976.1 TetR/AcrR family transcriptional regulator [Xanthovirga aplysinae]